MKKVLKSLLSLALLVGVAGCAKEPVEPDAPVETAYTAGTYTGEADGRNGMIKVEVTVSADKIESAKVTEHVETAGIAEPAVEKIPARVVECQSLGIDLMAGATVTSEAIIEALADALTKAGGDVEKLKEPYVAEKVQKDDMTTQVVIAGGGMAGLMAAATAAEEGAEVIVVEKLSQLGGSTLVSSGSFLTVESNATSAFEDTLDKPIAYYKEINKNSTRTPDYEFLTKIFNQNGEAIDFMVDTLGLTGTGKDTSSGSKFGFDGKGAGWVAGMEKALKDRNVTILLETEATEIVMDGDKAVGIKVEDKGGVYTINAGKVILATGGASWDEERMLKMIPQLNTVDLYERAAIGNSGDSFKMVEAIGGDMYQDLWIKASAPEYAQEFRFTSQTKPAIDTAIVVDAEGKRFTNESPMHGGVVTIEMIKHESPAYYVILDTVNINPDLKALLDARVGENNTKMAVYGATLEELATKLGMEPATLKATFDKYQAACDAGVDEEFGKDAKKLVKFAEEGGYYAVYQMPASYGTIGGCVTDEFGRVLKGGQPIPNLYAAGESSTYPLFGDYYVGAASLGLYAATGRIAAKTAVSEMGQ